MPKIKSSPDIPKPPRSNCASGKRWHSYYAATAAWNSSAADVIARTLGEDAVKYLRREALRFNEGATEIVKKTHPNIVSGQWKFDL